METKLKKRRMETGLTQVEVAEKAGLSVRYYQDLEAGKSRPAVDIAMQIAKALLSTVEKLF